jgi:exopolysaccharide biosynthesis polyprenyl glycosylphosphotransferase
VKRLLLVGASPLALRLIEEIEARPDCGYAVAAVVDDGTDPTNGWPLHRPLTAPLDRLDHIIEQVRPDRIILTLADWPGRLPARQFLQARVWHGIPFEDGIDLYERLTGKLAIEVLAPSRLLFTEGFSRSWLTEAMRRGLSILAAVLGLIMLAPLFGLIALAIKLDSRGPVFFTQRRCGLRGNAYTLLKFRTMHPSDARASEWIRDNEHRLTRVGRWLRPFRLDEIPQFVNILRGEMDFVGPRPHPASNYELFVAKIPYYPLRMAVRPGITGWSQVRYGYANDLDEETEKMRYDLYYIKHRSFWFDLRILFETVKIIFFTRAQTISTGRPIEADGRVPVLWDALGWAQVDERPSMLGDVLSSGGPQDAFLQPEPAPTVAMWAQVDERSAMLGDVLSSDSP